MAMESKLHSFNSIRSNLMFPLASTDSCSLRASHNHPIPVPAPVDTCCCCCCYCLCWCTPPQHWRGLSTL